MGEIKMDNIVVQEFNVKVEGKGFFVIKGSEGKEVMVPTFGFNKDGMVLSRETAEKEGYAPLQQEWIDEHIISASKCFRKAIHQEEHIDGQGHTFDMPEYHRDAIPEQTVVYVAVIKRSDAPNEIGIVSDISPMSVENSSISVEEVKEYKFS